MSHSLQLAGGLVALIDECDVDLVLPYRWSTQKSDYTSYAKTKIDGKVFLLHRLIFPGSDQVDHRDGDGLNNCRANLRPCTHAENMRNRRKFTLSASRFKGVTLDNGRWRVAVGSGSNRIYFGVFRSELQAAKQYDRCARLVFGSFAKTNEELGLLDGVGDRVLDASPRELATQENLRWRSEMARLGILVRVA